MDKLKLILGRPELADEVLRELDAIARDYDGYEYGLPTSSPPTAAQMREALYRWLVRLDDVLQPRGDEDSTRADLLRTLPVLWNVAQHRPETLRSFMEANPLYAAHGVTWDCKEVQTLLEGK